MNTEHEDLYNKAAEGLRRIFQAESTANIDSSIQFALTGENGVEFYTLICRGKLAIEPGRLPSPKVTMSMPAEEFLQMVAGTISPSEAFAKGLLKVGGNLFYAYKLAPVFKFGG